MGGCLFSSPKEHRAGDSASHAPPSPDPPGWVRTHGLPGQLERCLPEQGPEAAARSVQAAELRLLGQSSAGVQSWLGHFLPQLPFRRRARALDQGALCQCTSHLSQDKGWKSLILTAVYSSLEIYLAFCSSFSLPYNICQDFCLQFGRSRLPAAEAALLGKRP